MQTIKENKIKRIQEKIAHIDKLLSGNLNEQAKKECQKSKMKLILTLTCAISGLTVANKFIGYSFPVVRDNIKTYREKITQVSEDGTIYKTNGEYSYEEKVPLEKWFTNSSYNKESYLYNYSDWTSNISDNFIRYIEAYSIGDMSSEEIINLMQTENLNFKELFGEPTITYEYPSSIALSTKKNDIVICEPDKNDFIYQKENKNYNHANTFMFAALSISIFCFTNLAHESLKDKWLKNYEKNPSKGLAEYRQNLLEQKEILEEQREKESQKLQRIK